MSLLKYNKINTFIKYKTDKYFLFIAKPESNWLAAESINSNPIKIRWILSTLLFFYHIIFKSHFWESFKDMFLSLWIISTPAYFKSLYDSNRQF